MRERVKSAAEALCLATGLILLTSACGSNPPSVPLASAGMSPGGAQAGNANGGGGTGSRGSAQRDTTPTFDSSATTKYSACVTYIRAQCERRTKDCGARDRSEDPCAWSLDRCPDLYFSPGSTWTVDSLLSCAEEWKDFPCEDLRQNKRPDCAMPKGTRQTGEPCLFPNQCASNTCTDRKKDGSTIDGYPDCGVCGETSGLGGPCDTYGYECAPELACGASKKCEKRPWIGVVGSSCEDNSTCAGYAISCREDPSDGEMRCLEYPADGESCKELTCADGYFCNDAKVCTSAPSEGETCSANATAQCSVGLVCTGRFEDPPSTCISGHKLGEDCTGNPRTAPRGNCDAGLRCDCGELDCDLKAGVCRKVSGEGESCTDEDTMCAPGTACVDGKCGALESQPDLAVLCPS